METVKRVFIIAVVLSLSLSCSQGGGGNHPLNEVRGLDAVGYFQQVTLTWTDPDNPDFA